MCTLNSRTVLIHFLTISFPNPKRVLLKKIYVEIRT